MSFKFELDTEAANKAGIGGRMSKGSHTVTITQAYVTKTDNGNNIINIELKNDRGEIGFLNNICMDKQWASGKDNFNYPKFMELMGCAGAKSITLYESKTGSNQYEKKIEAIKELKDVKIRVVVFDTLGVFENKETRKLTLAGTFLPSGHTLSESTQKIKPERIYKLADRVEDYKTKEWKLWKDDDNNEQPENDDDFDFSDDVIEDSDEELEVDEEFEDDDEEFEDDDEEFEDVDEDDEEEFEDEEFEDDDIEEEPVETKKEKKKKKKGKK